MIDLLARILASSIRNLGEKQPDVFENTFFTNMTEWNLAHHLANEISQYIFWLDHDLDVIKKRHHNQRPDIIFHKRATNALNFLVIELKKNYYFTPESLRESEDYKKVKENWMGKKLHYRFGAFLNIQDRERYVGIIMDQCGSELFINEKLDYLPIPAHDEELARRIKDMAEDMKIRRHSVLQKRHTGYHDPLVDILDEAIKEYYIYGQQEKEK